MKRYWPIRIKIIDSNGTAVREADAATASQSRSHAEDGDESEDEYDKSRRERLLEGEGDADGWRAELQRYEADLSPEVTKKTDLVQFWSEHPTVYPTIACMAIDILPVAAASTGAESLFSRAKEVTTDRRSRLDPELLEQIQTLSWHWKGTLPDYASINQETVEVVGEEIKEFEFMESQDALLAEMDEPLWASQAQ